MSGFWQGVRNFNSAMRAINYIAPRRYYQRQYRRYLPQPQPHHSSGLAWFLFLTIIVLAIFGQH